MAETPACPRCGYDQRGVIDSWTQSCPLTGICSECGLEFAWGDVLGVRAKRLQGFFEHATGLRRSLLWAWRTWLWTIIPDRFWSRVRMHHRVAPRRIWLWLLVMLFSLHAIGSFAETSAIWSKVLLWGEQYDSNVWLHSIETLVKPLVDIWPWAEDLLYNYGSSPYGQWSLVDWPHGLTVGLGVSFVIALVFTLLSDTRRIYKVRLAHTLRVAVYGLAWIIPFAAMYTLYRVSLSLDFMFVENTQDAPGLDYFGSGLYWNIAAWIRSSARFAEDLFLVAVLVWTGWWWWVALDKGLQIERSGRIWCVLMVPATLTTAILLALIFAMRVHNSTSWW